MKNTILAAFAALSMVALQESVAFVWCDHNALSCGEEVPKDGPDEVYYLSEPLDTGSRTIPF
jgi:hypothetical protein